MRLAYIAPAAFAVLAMTCPAPARSADPPHIRIGWVVAPSDLAPLMFVKPGLASHAGKTYVPELTHFVGTSTIVTALAAGELDCATVAYSTFAIAVENAGMKDLRVVADSFQDGVDGYHTNDFMVRNDSPIHTVEDLKGKVLATNEAGSAIDMAARAMLAKHHLQDKRDVTFVEAPFPAMKAMLHESKVALIAPASPFDYDPELKSFAHTLFTQKDGMGRTQMIMRVVRGAWLAEHRAAMVDFMADYLAVLHYLLDPAHHDEAVALVAEATKQKPDYYADWLFTKNDYYRDPNGLPALDVLQANIVTQRELGFLKADFDVKHYADLGIVADAAKQLAAAPAQ